VNLAVEHADDEPGDHQRTCQCTGGPTPPPTSPVSVQRTPVSVQVDQLRLLPSPVSVQRTPVSVQVGQLRLLPTPVSVQRTPVSVQVDQLRLLPHLSVYRLPTSSCVAASRRCTERRPAPTSPPSGLRQHGRSIARHTS